MSGFQTEKNLIRTYYTALDKATDQGITQVLRDFTAPQYTWRAYHPFHVQTDVAEISATFWQPFRHAITSMQRRIDVFFAGDNVIDGGQSTWVVSMGHLMGLFDHPWLGIQPTGKMVMLRYAEFHKVEDNKITETAFYFDIPHLMAQAGQSPFADQRGAHNIQPGPQPHDAVMYDDADLSEGRKTIDAIHAMITDLGTWQSGLPIEEELARTWSKDMIWWGPAGIGSTYTIERYAKQHAIPFRAAFTDRSSTGHIARLAEGQYGGFFGWPNFTARPTNGYLGLPPSDRLCEFRVIDLYRRENDKLAENWVFIDLLHFFSQMGVNLLDES
ncbi:polyketide cyclase [Amylibacter marinus]|uniref:Polyketide cyclase n=1 Tax=Amylibacter marinus TaxID=1475483 RepID=A0ABQ5VY83_9RHOB|nr:ester cyclase [Amylibacter marinus]GLQ36217.1 polyketide cyclase [Amylibacter marinus]